MTKFSIELERPSGVFYAGEVVRGTVKLTCSSAVTCRSFNIQFKGEAKVHWHVGAGDNRTDYYGHTLYQEQRMTVRGGFYKTGLLDEAGENANFDMIPGLGVIQIPCTAQETANLSLIVRVMDYDWGKKDDLLGEIQLDAPALVATGTQKSFPLFRNGKPEKGEVTLSAKYLPYDALFPMTSRSGVAVSLSVHKEHCLILTVHQATGLRKADWIGHNDVYVQVYRAADAKTEVVPGKKLPGPHKKMVLPKGTEIIAPFAFALRHDAPPSAEIGVRDRSHIRYKVRAYIDLANWRDPFAKTILTVIPNRPIPLPKLLSPHVAESGPEPIYSCPCCSACKYAVITTKLIADRIAYAPGERIDLSQSTVFYEGDKEIKAEVVLMGYFRLKTFFTSTTSHRAHTLHTFTLTPNATTQLGQLSITVPPVYPSFYGGTTNHQRTHYSCLQWTYTLGIKVGGGSFVQATLPVLISSAPPYQSVLEEFRDQTPKRTTASIWSIFEDAVVGPNQTCSTAPTITGPEDGGTVVSVGAPVDTWESAEDNHFTGGGGQESMSYQPVVTTFTGPMETVSEQSTTGTQSSVDTLLQNLDDELDKRLAVGKWIQQHWTQAQNLTPEDYSAIMSKVTFSLDQPSVVNELVSVMEGSKRLTCQHIVATMNACPYQKSEVATIMASHVCDPQNKEIVLNNLEYSFDKKSVSEEFPEEEQDIRL